jgi:hypothetical protein
MIDQTRPMFWSTMRKRRTFEEVLIDNALVLFGNDHAGWYRFRAEATGHKSSQSKGLSSDIFN